MLRIRLQDNVEEQLLHFLGYDNLRRTENYAENHGVCGNWRLDFEIARGHTRVALHNQTTELAQADIDIFVPVEGREGRRRYLVITRDATPTGTPFEWTSPSQPIKYD